MKSIQEIAKELHEINFGSAGIIRTQFNNDGDYTYEDWKANDKDGSHRYTDINNCCCDMCNCYNTDVLSDEYKDKNHKYQFTNVSHGTHMLDFLKAHGVDISKIDGWSTKPIIFVMENPSNGKNNRYVELSELKDKSIKRPSKSWYWLNSSYDDKNDFFYPNFFTQGEYGKLVYSIMNTFKIANGYLTNMVKCGVGYYNDDETDVYFTTEKYNKGIIENCINKKLRSEIDALRRVTDEKVIVFAFALNTYNFLNDYLKDDIANEKINIYLLPHPANRLANDYRKYVLFGKIARALELNHFYDAVEKLDYMSVLTSDSEVIPDLKIKKENLNNLIADIKSNTSSIEDEFLKKFIDSLKEVKFHDNYNCEKLTYVIKTVGGGLVSDLTLMYKAPTNKKLREDGITKVIWINYNLADDYIETWIGKDNKATELINAEAAEIFSLYKLMQFIIKTIKAENNKAK